MLITQSFILLLQAKLIAEIHRKVTIFYMSKSRGRGVSGRTHTQAQINNYANQHNPNNNAYKTNLNNHANQCNPNNSQYASHDNDNE